ncbi:MAG TPA: hypothetical protein VGK74_25765 [Symbiobacteriaceae bacterium]
MRRWISERLDDAMLPLLKLASPGYRGRLAPYRAAEPCDLCDLDHIRPPEDVAVFDEPAWRGYRVQGYCYPSPVDCRREENNAVHGRLIIVDEAAPWALVVPGYATGAFPPKGYSLFQDVQGLALLEQSINVALIDLPFHLKRKQRGQLSGEGFFSPDLGETQTAVRQATADAISLVRWLEQRSGRPVGLWGTSLGGCIAGLVAARVASLAGVVLMEPLDNPGSVLAALPGTWEIRELLVPHGVEAEHLEEAFKSVAPSSYPPAVPRERILFVTPLWDRVVPTRFQEAFWEAWGKPERILWKAGHITMATNRALNTQASQFLSRWILNRSNRSL